MKAGHFTMGALAMLGFVAAQPHRNRHHQPAKRAAVTKTTVVTVTGAQVVIWVDEHGVPYATSTDIPNIPATPTANTIAMPITQETYTATVTISTSTVQVKVATAPTAAASSTTAESTSEVASSTTPVEVSEPTSSATTTCTTLSETPGPTAEPSSSVIQESSAVAAPSSAVPEPSSVKSETPAPTQTPSGGIPIGIAYDPFSGPSSSPSCKSESHIASDFNAMKSYGVVRLYGVGCNQVALGLQHARAKGQKLILGIHIPQETVSDDVAIFSNAINQYANGKWDDISVVTVGNERVNMHGMTASAVVDAINDARQKLRAAGYNGPIGTVDTVPATIDNPSLCQNSDYAMVNCHAFFDSNISAENAGTFVKGKIQQLEKACPGKKIVITESGWPSSGDTNGKAVPSPDNQKSALQSLRNTFSDSLILFSAFNSDWKSDFDGTYNAEKYWGSL